MDPRSALRLPDDHRRAFFLDSLRPRPPRTRHPWLACAHRSLLAAVAAAARTRAGRRLVRGRTGLARRAGGIAAARRGGDRAGRHRRRRCARQLPPLPGVSRCGAGRRLARSGLRRFLPGRRDPDPAAVSRSAGAGHRLPPAGRRRRRLALARGRAAVPPPACEPAGRPRAQRRQRGAGPDERDRRARRHGPAAVAGRGRAADRADGRAGSGQRRPLLAEPGRRWPFQLPAGPHARGAARAAAA